MKKLLLAIALIASMCVSLVAQNLSVQIISPQNGDKINGKLIHVDCYCVTTNPDQIYPILFEAWADGVLFGYGYIFYDEVIVTLDFQTSVNGPHTFLAKISDDLELAYSDTVTVFKGRP